MSVPLDRLYDFLHSVSDHDISIYRFYPHGSKKLDDLKPMQDVDLDFFAMVTSIIMVCYDQEPLNYDLYKYSLPKNPPEWIENGWISAVELRQQLFSNFKSVIPLSGVNLNDRCLLLHSEKNSTQLALYEKDNYIGVYYWSHALIARDWFRYAAIDPCQKIKTTWPNIDFLIYNRAWNGTREYRIKFTELLIQYDLTTQCKTKFNPIDEIHYSAHKFSNKDMAPLKFDLEEYFSINDTHSSASADYNQRDYEETAIEVVLETLFDDQRHHLTEKTLRPIACGHPFILAATPGSLKYLRDYGFKTFSPWINETYDSIQDPVLRLHHILSEMKRISELSIEEKNLLNNHLQEISQYNKSVFFSDKFFQLVVEEYKNNLKNAIETLRPLRKGSNWTNLRKFLYKNYGRRPVYNTFNKGNTFTKEINLALRNWIRNPPEI